MGDAATGARLYGKLRMFVPWILALAAVALPVALSLRRSLSVDEYLYLHWAYEASRGVFAGADYFATHFPFMQVLFAPAFWVERATPERGAVVARVASALMAIGTVRLAFLSYDRVKGVTGTGVAPRWVPSAAIAAIAVGACDSYANRITEVRPDNVFVFFLLLSIACFPDRRHRARAWVSGACLGCAMLSSEKMSVAIGSLIAAHAAALALSGDARARARERVLGADGRDFVLGVVVACVFGVLVSCGGNLRGEVEQMTALWSYLQGRFSQRRPFFENPGADGYVILLEACAASLVVIPLIALFGKHARGADGARRPFRWSPTYLGLLLGGALIYGIQKESYEYSRVLLFVVAVPLLADAIAAILAAVPAPRFVAVTIASALLGALAYHGLEWSRQEPRSWPGEPTLDSNLEMLADVRRATTADDCVYDNSMGAFFRNHAHSRYVMTDHFMRDTQGAQLADQIPKAILERGCVGMMVDYRNGGMPISLQRFLDSHFVPVSPYYYLYATKLVTRADVEDVLAEPVDFHAPQTSWYAADPPGATVRLSHEDDWSERIWLERGDHKMFVSRSDARLIFQPRDGTPRPPYRGGLSTKFSHI